MFKAPRANPEALFTKQLTAMFNVMLVDTMKGATHWGENEHKFLVQSTVCWMQFNMQQINKEEDHLSLTESRKGLRFIFTSCMFV